MVVGGLSNMATSVRATAFWLPLRALTSSLVWRLTATPTASQHPQAGQTGVAIGKMLHELGRAIEALPVLPPSEEEGVTRCVSVSKGVDDGEGYRMDVK